MFCSFSRYQQQRILKQSLAAVGNMFSMSDLCRNLFVDGDKEGSTSKAEVPPT